MNGTQIIAEALIQPRDAIYSHLSRSIAQALPEQVVLETEEPDFDVHAYAHEGMCTMTPHPDVHQQWDINWDGYHERVVGTIYNTWHLVEWEGNTLQVVSVGVQQQHCRGIRHFVIALNEAAAKGFFEAVCRHCSEVRGEILVFTEGHWSKSSDLYNSVKETSLDNLILANSLKEDVLNDFTQFFGCRDTYAQYRIPWKRGVLFLGPPGNGKTHAIKGLINTSGKPCLYVRSFSAEYGSDHDCISRAFAKARESAPCLFVLEDLDSLVNDSNRSYFLNELDGFYANEGLLTVATTNHPERLDPAILDRPSRFDRKYTFALPGVEERQRYISGFGERLEPELRLSKEGIESVASLTEDFSFAYLKELFLSSMMQWIGNPGAVPMDLVMTNQVQSLREQMATASEGFDSVGTDNEGDFPPGVPPNMRAYYRRFMKARRPR